MNRKVNIEMQTRTRDAYGGFTVVWSNRHTQMPCRIQPMSGKERSLYSRETSEITHKMFYEARFTGVLEEDRVKDGTLVYDIIAVRNIDLMDHHFEAELKEIRAEV